MKKLIPILIVALILVGCSSGHLTPIYNTDINSNAVYTIGDYSFSCTITYKHGTATVLATSTRATGLKLICDGKMATYSHNNMTKTVPANTVSPLNPSKVIYSVFSTLPKANITTKDSITTYTGTIPLGDYTLTTNNNQLQTLSIPTAKITIKFI